MPLWEGEPKPHEGDEQLVGEQREGTPKPQAWASTRSQNTKTRRKIENKEAKDTPKT